ncbi:MAG: 2-phosphosulfolactate phosphatase [Anaerolineae bacterium]
MRIERASLETCNTAVDTVVVIDVIRAFTTAAYAFAAGARDIIVVSTVEEALALRQSMPGALVMGEVNGLQPKGFDLGNSPSALIGMNLAGQRLIQRTSAGTQGIVRSSNAESLYACSFVCARATARRVQSRSPASVTCVITGAGAGWDGDEDAACADYLTALWRGESPDMAPLIQRVRTSRAGRGMADPVMAGTLQADLQCCVRVDLYDFAMKVERQGGHMVMQAIP